MGEREFILLLYSPLGVQTTKGFNLTATKKHPEMECFYFL